MKISEFNDIRPNESGNYRSAIAKSRRIAAVEVASDEAQRPKIETPSNGDNLLYACLPMAFTKGLEHDTSGMVKTNDYYRFADALTTVDRKGHPESIFDVPTAEKANVLTYCTRDNTQPAFRQWESPLAGHYFCIEGPDPDAVAIAPAPRFGENELTAELAEVYAMAITRDMSFDELSTADQTIYHVNKQGIKTCYRTTAGREATVQDLVNALNSLAWFREGVPMSSQGTEILSNVLTRHEIRRQRARGENASPQLTVRSLFRGSTRGSCEGNYLSEFLTLGTGEKPHEGIIGFGAQTINQQVKPGRRGVDYMTSWAEWLDVQNGLDLSGGYPTGSLRSISHPRDLVEYVHVDQLYQAYFNACLIISGSHSASHNLIDAGFPNHDHSTRGGFATFGNTHILSLFAEVASRALKAVRRQKFQIHRRARPERLAAMITLLANGHTESLDADTRAATQKILDELGIGTHSNPAAAELMRWVTDYNRVQNSKEIKAQRNYQCDTSNAVDLPDIADDGNYLLAMAFPEGSPMHPAYGAGHATVAGACVTVLKAHFSMVNKSGMRRSMSDINGGSPHLTIEGELNKLASNISIGRNFAGVHYYSDYYDSLRMGERIATGILQEQMLTFNEPVNMHWHSFDDDSLLLKTDGGQNMRSPVLVVNGDDRPTATAAWWARHIHEYEINSLPHAQPKIAYSA